MIIIHIYFVKRLMGHETGTASPTPVWRMHCQGTESNIQQSSSAE